MDAFVEAYFAIDKTGSGVITTGQLRKYMEANNYEEAFMTKWLTLFDKNNTGKITLEEYCETLGLEAKQVLAQHQSQQKAALGRLPDDIQVISADMPLDFQIKSVDIVKDAFAKYGNEKEVAKNVKMALDKLDERLWHVVIVQGQYWSYYSHEPTKSFVFKMGRHIILLWRTPGY